MIWAGGGAARGGVTWIVDKTEGALAGMVTDEFSVAQ